MADTALEPIAANQLRLWINQEFDVESNAYNVTRCLRMRGNIDAGALVNAVNALVERHEILRTVLVESGGTVLQQVLAPEPTLPDVVHAPAAATDADLVDAARRFTLRPFDLRREPPFRAELVRVADDDHMLSLAFHHIGVDGWSLALFEQELREAYRSFATTAAWRPVTTAGRFRDFAGWQREILTPEVVERQLEYWRSTLPAEPPPSAFLASAPFGTSGPGPAAIHDVAVERDVIDGITRLRSVFDLTTFGVLQVAIQILAQRFSGNTDVVLGGTTLNRKSPAFESTLGFFVNTVPLHTPLADNPSFGDALARGKEAVVEAMSHDDVPFDRIAEAVAPRPSGGRNGLYRIAVETTAAAPAGAQTWDDIDVNVISFDGDVHKSARCDLTFNLLQHETGKRLVLEYDTSLFDQAQAAGIARALCTLIAEGARDPATPIEDLPLVDVPAREALLTARSYPPHNAITAPTSEIVRALAVTDAARTAVTTPEARLTFCELVARAEVVAAELADRGVGPGSFVGVAADRSVHSVVAVLGAWFARCAYVPIDPATNEERQRYIIEDAGVEHVLGPGEFAAQGAELIEVASLPAGTGRMQPVRTTEPEDIAYAIYTSGTTGKPKATLATHANMLNVLAGLGECFEVPDWRRETVSLNGPLVFDVSLQQLLPMLAGAGVAVVPGAVRLDPQALMDYVAAAGITLLDVTPAHLQVLVEEGLLDRSDLPLRRLISGGEALPAGLWERLARTPWLEVFNCYGPTECTVNTTVQKVDEQAERPNIGTEVHGACLFVADAKRRLVPYGAIGELYIAGAGLGPGYLNQPELTAERFVQAPWGPGGRLIRVYRTGDRVRLAKSGVVEHLGRLDEQVKVRGNRVELGEVTSTVLAYPGVRAAETIVDDDGPNGTALYAFVVAPEGSVEQDELEQHLRSSLPPYMVPARIIRLPALPTGVSGKVDRRALRDLAARAADAQPRPAAARTAAANETEQRLIELWNEVLGLPSCDPGSHFFGLGGHSLLAARLLARIRREFAAPFTLRTLLENPTPRRCAQRLRSSLERDAAESGRQHLITLNDAADDAPLFCFHPLGGDVLVYQDLVEAMPVEKRIYGVFDGLTDARTRTGWESSEEMVHAYAAEIAEVLGHGGCHLAGWSLGGLIAHAAAARLEQLGVRVRSLTIWDAGCASAPSERPSEPDWSAGPLTVLTTLAPPDAEGLCADDRARLAPDLAVLSGRALGSRILREAERKWGVRPAAEPQAVADRAVVASLHNWLFTGWYPEPVETGMSVSWASDSVRRELVRRTDWSAHTRSAVRETEVEATHYSLIRNPAVNHLAAELGKTIQTTAGR